MLFLQLRARERLSGVGKSIENLDQSRSIRRKRGQAAPGRPVVASQRLRARTLDDKPVEDVRADVSEGQLRDADAQLVSPGDHLVDVGQGSDD